MRQFKLYIILSLALLFLFIKSTFEHQTFIENSKNNLFKTHFLLREKRQLEDLENDEYPTPAGQQAEEESGFWDRVVKVALRLFNKFIEWLNSS